MPTDGSVEQLPVEGTAPRKMRPGGSVSVMVTFSAALLPSGVVVAVSTKVKAWPARGLEGLTALEIVTSASAVTSKVSLPVLFARLGSKVTLDLAVALLVRKPASPPGRTAIWIVGQLVPAVQTGNVAMEQLKRTVVPVAPPIGACEQFMPEAAFGDQTPCTKPPPALLRLLMRPVRSSVKVMVEEVPLPSLTISIANCSMSPEAMVLLSAVLMTRMSAWLPLPVEFTPRVIVLFLRFGSGKFGLTVVTVMELVSVVAPETV